MLTLTVIFNNQKENISTFCVNICERSISLIKIWETKKIKPQLFIKSNYLWFLYIFVSLFQSLLKKHKKYQWCIGNTELQLSFIIWTTRKGVFNEKLSFSPLRIFSYQIYSFSKTDSILKPYSFSVHFLYVFSHDLGHCMKKLGLNFCAHARIHFLEKWCLKGIYVILLKIT